MVQQKFPDHLQDKIFEVRYRSDDSISKIVSYFPFTDSEKQELLSILNDDSFDRFHSIFTDYVSDKEWARTRDQIKKKFKNELFDIDRT